MGREAASRGDSGGGDVGRGQRERGLEMDRRGGSWQDRARRGGAFRTCSCDGAARLGRRQVTGSGCMWRALPPCRKGRWVGAKVGPAEAVALGWQKARMSDDWAWLKGTRKAWMDGTC